MKTVLDRYTVAALVCPCKVVENVHTEPSEKGIIFQIALGRDTCVLGPNVGQEQNVQLSG